VKNLIKAILVDSRGSAIVEYALLTSLIGVTVISALSLMGDRLTDFIKTIASVF